MPECRIDYWDPRNDATAIDAASAAGYKADARRTGLAKAVEAVLASRDEKTLEDARAALDARTGEARALLDSSDGRVQDSATRDALSQAIDQATAGRGGDDPAAIDALTDALGQAMDRVNESIAAKQQADCLWSNKAVRCRHLFWTVMAFILDSVGGRHRCDMRAPVPLVS